MINIREKLSKVRIEDTPSERPVPNRDSIKKFYSKSNLEFISETITSLQDLNNQSPSIT